SAIEAVNEGHIFQFLTKPYSHDRLQNTLDLCIKQYQLINSEKDILKNTVTGVVKVLLDILYASNPLIFNQTVRIKTYITHICQKINVKETWQYELAAALCHIGCMALPKDLNNKTITEGMETEEKKRLLQTVAQVGYQLISNIPRLEAIAEMIRDMDMPFQQFPKVNENSNQKKIALGSQLLKVAVDFDNLIIRGMSKERVIQIMGKNEYEFNPSLVNCLESLPLGWKAQNKRIIKTEDLQMGMVTTQNIHSTNGLLLVSRDNTLTADLIRLIKHEKHRSGVDEPFEVILSNG
ncbi:hypothetical protein BVY01_03110, partial [bacterium I07]